MMHVMIEYENGVSFNYQLTCFGTGPSDGIIFGRHGSLTTQGGDNPTLYPHYGEPRPIEVKRQAGGHGGADPILFRDLFDSNAPEDHLMRLSDHHAGSWSGLIGMAATKSMEEDRPILIRELVSDLEVPPTPAMAESPDGIDIQDIRQWVVGHAEARAARAKAGKRTVADTYGQNG